MIYPPIGIITLRLAKFYSTFIFISGLHTFLFELPHFLKLYYAVTSRMLAFPYPQFCSLN